MRFRCTENTAHLIAQARVAEGLGIDKDNIFILSSGDVLELDEESAAVTGKVHTGAIMVDGLGVGDVGNIVLRDRQHLARRWYYHSCIDIGRRLRTECLQDLISYPVDLFMSVVQRHSWRKQSRCWMRECNDCMDKGITDWGKIEEDEFEILSVILYGKRQRDVR